MFYDSDEDLGGARNKRGKKSRDDVDYSAPVAFVSKGVTNQQPEAKETDNENTTAGLGAGSSRLGFGGNLGRPA